MSSKEDEIKNASIEDRFKMAIKNPEFAGLVYKANETDRQKNVAEKAQRASHPVLPSPTSVMQGDTRGLHPTGLHTLTMAEIVADANRSDPTVSHFDTNSDFMKQVDPLAPHFDLSSEFPTQVTPLKPGPKIPTNG